MHTVSILQICNLISCILSGLQVVSSCYHKKANISERMTCYATQLTESLKSGNILLNYLSTKPVYFVRSA
jgi:hypothetical protein